MTTAVPVAPEASPRAPEFLSGPMSALVDCIRVVSATAVMIAHSHALGFHSGQPFVGPMGAHYAVVVFFVVSGLAVGTGAARPGTGLADYALARGTRIVPVAAFALAFATLAFVLKGPVPVFEPQRGVEVLTWQAVVHPLLFLTETATGQLPVWNAPWWSLSYEAWYYALLGAAVFLRGTRRLIWLGAVAVIAGLPILLLLPVWLAGVALAWFPAWVRLDRRAGAALLALAVALFALGRAIDLPVLVWLAAHSPLPLVNSQNLAGDLVVGAAVALGLAGVRPWLPAAAGLAGRLAPMLRWLSGLSFTTYLFHQPLLCLLRSWGLAAPAGTLGAVAGLAGVLACCAVLAALGERRTPALRRWLVARADRAHTASPTRPLAASPA
ncbi:acyltransferase family protein [Novosphingobium bradum]|uniref:Acyltransferase family protein n=1 Tax=Novosphingobium bradum TaxID=1737444 RepID=A0ABV7IKL5_9SPHN